MRRWIAAQTLCRFLGIGVIAFTSRCIAAGSTDTTASPTASLTPTELPSARKQPLTRAVREEQQTIAVYQSIIRRMYMQDRTYVGGLSAPILFLERSTNDFAGDPDAHKSNSVILPETVRQGITYTLNDLPAWIVWIEHFGDVARDPERGCVENRGVIITLSNIRYDETDVALVGGSILRCDLAAAGFEYVVEIKGGFWNVTSSRMRWIS